MKIFKSKWFFIPLVIILGLIFIKLVLPSGNSQPLIPTLYEMVTDRTRYYLSELVDYNFRIYQTMMDEVRADLNWFYFIISLVGISGIIITLQVIAAITRLPIGYLAYPGKFLVVKRSKVLQIQINQNKGDNA